MPKPLIKIQQYNYVKGPLFFKMSQIKPYLFDQYFNSFLLYRNNLILTSVIISMIFNFHILIRNNH